MHLSSYGIYHDFVQLDYDAQVYQVSKFEDGLVQNYHQWNHAIAISWIMQLFI
jgi:hypothetical protein